ncbi:MAG: undecaprenyl/decaprenyl-phosphate alpha-N-acetylglucosaminyl 1-phosphate transferase [Clostridia bacterium]|nr:undecaprenyl/decaprenyl-phosphate alpha-N-acetylglucosaminyl 1-phosphate transferase [Clostridia bacterium]
MKFVFAFLVVFIIVYVLIPALKKVALKVGFVDRPTGRKKHKRPVPLLGGLGIFIGFVFTYSIFIRPINKEFISILAAASLILIIGLIDDWFKTKGKEFPVLPRLVIQILAAVMVYKAGIVFYGFTNPITHEYIVLPQWIQFVLTITWILGVTTVINWSDGMDGLAGSISAISAATLFVVALVKHQTDSAMMSLILLGAIAGFLKYNRHPAQVFMGDSGANFLGFILGIVALDGAFKQATLVSLLVPILALGVPILDNLFVVIRRLVQKKPIYQADSGQIHHRLLATGLSQKQVLVFLSLVSLCSSFLSIIILLLKI